MTGERSFRRGLFEPAGRVPQPRSLGIFLGYPAGAANRGRLFFGYFLFGEAKESDWLSGHPRQSPFTQTKLELLKLITPPPSSRYAPTLHRPDRSTPRHKSPDCKSANAVSIARNSPVISMIFLARLAWTKPCCSNTKTSPSSRPR